MCSAALRSNACATPTPTLSSCFIHLHNCLQIHTAQVRRKLPLTAAATKGAAANKRKPAAAAAGSPLGAPVAGKRRAGAAAEGALGGFQLPGLGSDGEQASPHAEHALLYLPSTMLFLQCLCMVVLRMVARRATLSTHMSPRTLMSQHVIAYNAHNAAGIFVQNVLLTDAVPPYGALPCHSSLTTEPLSSPSDLGTAGAHDPATGFNLGLTHGLNAAKGFGGLRGLNLSPADAAGDSSDSDEDATAAATRFGGLREGAGRKQQQQRRRGGFAGVGNEEDAGQLEEGTEEQRAMLAHMLAKAIGGDDDDNDADR